MHYSYDYIDEWGNRIEVIYCMDIAGNWVRIL